MMFILFLIFTNSLKPLFLVSGFNGSPLYATVTQSQISYEARDYCPKDLEEHFQFYPSVNPKFYMKYPDCQAYLMSAHYDAKEKKVTPSPGVKIVSDNFGNYTSLLNFEKIVEYALAKGYTPYKDLFGIGYNFLLYPLDTDDTFAAIKENAERVKKETGEKVVFISHSQGTHLVNQFLTSYSKLEWVKEYIDAAIFVAPAWAGVGNYRRLVNGDYGEFLTNENMKKTLAKMPGQLILLPNYEAFGNKTVIYNYPQYGQNSIAKDIPNFLRNYLGILNQENSKIFEEVEKFLMKPIDEPPVRNYILYNSGINTGVAYMVDKYTKDLRIVLGPGDGDYSPEGAEFACEHWKNVKCINWNLNKQTYNHANMLKNIDASVEMIFDFVEGEPSTPAPTHKSKTDLYTIIFGVGIIMGLQILILVFSIIYIKKFYSDKSDGTLKESDTIKSTSEL
ncbi:hypothetical protein M9Y10_027068 [Tritrichomonas musculus]|uniref:Lecithin:cholesterol acyltransferase family protein n=1 Tax=Tritrichomonas musculus TaxID=1915356 RepID=A0ABR2H5G3_9EUKA